MRCKWQFWTFASRNDHGMTLMLPAELRLSVVPFSVSSFVTLMQYNSAFWKKEKKIPNVHSPIYILTTIRQQLVSLQNKTPNLVWIIRNGMKKSTYSHYSFSRRNAYSHWGSPVVYWSRHAATKWKAGGSDPVHGECFWAKQFEYQEPTTPSKNFGSSTHHVPLNNCLQLISHLACLRCKD